MEKLQFKKTTTQFKKWATELNTHFTKENIQQMFNIINHWGNAYQTPMRHHFTTSLNDYKKSTAKNVEKFEPLYTIGENAKLYKSLALSQKL